MIVNARGLALALFEVVLACDQDCKALFVLGMHQ